MRFPGPGNLALWCRRSTDMPLCLCPSLSTKSFLFHGLEGPLSFSDPRPPLNYTFPRLVLPLRECFERIISRPISYPCSSKFIFDAGRYVVRMGNGFDTPIRRCDVRSRNRATGEENIQRGFIYICICGGDLNYTDRYFRG